MSDLQDPLKFPDELRSTGDPIPRNPFPEGDPLHVVWRGATREAEEASSRLNSDYLTAQATGRIGFASCILILYLGKFDIWAKRFTYVLWTDKAVLQFDQWLADYAEALLRAMADGDDFPPSINGHQLKNTLRMRLIQRREDWKAYGRRFLAEAKSQLASRNKPAKHTDTPTPVTQAGKSSKASETIQNKSKALRNPDAEIIKRRAIVKENPTLRAQGICRLFDESHVPLTKSLQEAVTWSKAFKAPRYRHSVESLISRDRKATLG